MKMSPHLRQAVTELSTTGRQKPYFWPKRASVVDLLEGGKDVIHRDEQVSGYYRGLGKVDRQWLRLARVP